LEVGKKMARFEGDEFNSILKVKINKIQTDIKKNNSNIELII
jgi:hypothetical protein